MDLYTKSVIPEARLALESSMASYETGALGASEANLSEICAS